jgi:hypothetical protein
MAGAVYPSDARAGLDLGRAVAAQVLEYTKTHDVAEWAGLAPAGRGIWKGAVLVPVEERGWTFFVLTSTVQVRPGPPPLLNSAAYE